MVQVHKRSIQTDTRIETKDHPLNTQDGGVHGSSMMITKRKQAPEQRSGQDSNGTTEEHVGMKIPTLQRNRLYGGD